MPPKVAIQADDRRRLGVVSRSPGVADSRIYAGLWSLLYISTAMPRVHLSGRPFALASAYLLVLIALALSACGGSSSPAKSSSASVRQSAITPPNVARRFQALTECLQRNGITLPKRSNTPGVGGFLGGSQLPKGVSRAKFDATLRKCGGLTRSRPRTGATNRFNTPAAKRTFAKFVTCMRQQGVNLPQANTSGHGPVFDTKGLNPTGARFRSAQAKCLGVLRELIVGGAGAAAGAAR
jgi:hypothetical protein